ncbi:ATP-binding cassette domain-containing protein [Reinekea blandensis]|uniref:Thiamine transport ATP-binding protein ThiQ n=1 Tax=Reinekea blandensis MED297 TaxID=314283 RepID=A4BCA5_9GAMM|nr:ATP-binding cassette domain-containing protein [Reinekea blandensis]EAR10171.1 thiamine transport ATP-binding protein ThiQ [Reinekea sp. MED297] [Reinekea blandensis MED297]
MLEVQDLVCRLGTHRFHWNFSVPEQSFLAVTGPSGLGKSSLLNALLGFLPSESGRICWRQQDLSHASVAARPFGVLFQRDNLFEHLSVEKNLSLGLSPSGRLSGVMQEQLLEAARRFQIDDLLKKRAGALSGGQQQRVALSRVFLQNRPVLLLDEPFSSLDPGLRRDGLDWVQELQREQKTTIVMVTHHLAEVREAASHVLEGVSSDQWTQYPA